MDKFNLNYQIVIYPNEKGWERIRDIVKSSYKFDNDEDFETFFKRKITPQNGYKDQLWCIMSDLHEIFFNGTTYLQTTVIDLINE